MGVIYMDMKQLNKYDKMNVLNSDGNNGIDYSYQLNNSKNNVDVETVDLNYVNVTQENVMNSIKSNLVDNRKISENFNHELFERLKGQINSLKENGVDFNGRVK